MFICHAEYDGLLPQDTELAQQTNVPDVFGATTEDTQGLRIVSLFEVCCSLRTDCDQGNAWVQSSMQLLNAFAQDTQSSVGSDFKVS